MSTETFHFDVHTEFSPSISDLLCFYTCWRRCSVFGEKFHMIFPLYYKFASLLIIWGPLSSRVFKVQVEMIELVSLILPEQCLNNGPRNWI